MWRSCKRDPAHHHATNICYVDGDGMASVAQEIDRNQIQTQLPIRIDVVVLRESQR